MTQKHDKLIADYFRKNDPVAAALLIGASYAQSGKTPSQVFKFVSELAGSFFKGTTVQTPLKISQETLEKMSKR